MAARLPAPVKAVLWSYDTELLDLERHKARIITNVLNLGTHEVLLWLFKAYPLQDIAEVVAHPRPGEWNRKSLNYWSLVFGVEPKMPTRF